MKRVGQLKRKRIGRDKYRARVYGGLPAGAAGCGCHLPCHWRCCSGWQLGVRKELISSSTCHHFANVQGTLALFAGLLAPAVCILPWRTVKFSASLVVFWLIKWPIFC